MAHRQLRLPALVIAALNLSACDILFAKLDPAMGRADRETLAGDITRLTRYRIRAREGSVFTRVFGAADSAAVIRYLDTRINYVFPASVRVDSRLNARLPYQVDAGELFGLTAVNVGIRLWQAQEAARPARVEFSLGGTWIPVRSSRVGILKLGKDYRYFDPLDRIKTLIHEARHSDCTGGFSDEDRRLFREDKPVANQRCGYDHVVCPIGHEDEDEFACETVPWGSLAMEAIYLRTLARTCSNCTRAEKIAAHALALDALDRILLDTKALFSGRLGWPDMSSHGAPSPEQKLELQTFRAERLNSIRSHSESGPGERPLGVHGDHLVPNLEMKMRAGSPSGLAGERDPLTLNHPISLTYQKLRAVSIESRDSQHVTDHDDISVSGDPVVGKHDDTP